MIIDPDMPDHWKTRMLVDLLGGDELAPLYLIRLWGHCQNRKKYEFDSLPVAAVKAICRFQGDADDFNSALIECGFIERDGGYLLVTGWADHNAALVKNWVNGKQGGRPPKQGKQETQGEPKNNPKETQEEPNGNPTETIPGFGVTDREDREDREDKTEKKMSDIPPAWLTRFDDFWSDYPKRVGKGAAESAWKKIKPNEELAGKIKKAVSAAKLSSEWTKDGGQYIPNPATWLNQKRWEDELTAAPPPHSPRASHKDFTL